MWLSATRFHDRLAFIFAADILARRSTIQLRMFGGRMNSLDPRRLFPLNYLPLLDTTKGRGTWIDSASIRERHARRSFSRRQRI